MAVQKSRRTPSTRGNRRSHDSLVNPCLSIDKKTGDIHLRHHMTNNGFYRNKKII